MDSTLAERIDALFRSHPSPRNREYTYREVASSLTGKDGITFSPAYLWQLRTGAKDNPTMRHLEALACFFGVSPAYFFDDQLAELPGVEDRLFVASSRNTLREVAMNLIGLSEGSLNAVLQLTCRLREIEGLTCADSVPGSADGASQTSNPGSTTRRKRSVRKKAESQQAQG
jgi:transcriptional regulator with XRE-family HTH domain